MVTKAAIARFLISAAVFAIAAGCDGRGGLTPKDDSRVVSGDITTWGDPRNPNGNPLPVPEPRVLLVVGLGLVGLAILRRRRTRET